MTTLRPTTIQALSRRTALQCLSMGVIAPLLPASFAIAQSPSAAALSAAESSVDLPDRIVPDGLFVNPRGDNTEQVAQLVKSLGLESIRLGFIWVNFEKTMGAPFDFTKHDRLMAEYRQAGIRRFIGLIGSQNEAYHCVWRQKDHDLREGALAAFAKFAGALAERYRDYDILWENRLATDNSDDYVAAFERDGKRILAAWTSAAPHPLKLAVSSGKATVTDLLGSRRESPATEGHITLNLTGGIQYVEM